MCVVHVWGGVFTTLKFWLDSMLGSIACIQLIFFIKAITMGLLLLAGSYERNIFAGIGHF